MHRSFTKLSQDRFLPIGLLESYLSVISTGMELPVVTEKTVYLLANEIEHFIKSYLSDDLERSAVLHWLTQGLDFAITRMDSGAAIRIGEVICQLANKDPDLLAQMLGKVIESGSIKGHNTAYFWMRALYLATFGIRNDGAILAINLIFTHLIHHAKEPIQKSLLFRCLEGPREGENGIYLLSLAINKLSLDKLDNPLAEMLTTLLFRLMAQMPESSDRDALIELKGSILLRDKHTLYVLVTTLKEAVKHNPPVVSMICSILSRIITHQPIDILNVAFFKPAVFGESQGLASIHILLTALVSATYIRGNNEVIANLCAIINQLILAAPPQMLLALTHDIIRDRRANTNGISWLVQSLVAATEHELDIAPISQILIKLIDTDSISMAKAFKDSVVLDREDSVTISPLERLIKTVTLAKKGDKSLVIINGIIEKLAESTFYEQFKSSLPKAMRALLRVNLGKKSVAPELVPEAVISAAGVPDEKVYSTTKRTLLFSSGVEASTDSPLFSIDTDDSKETTTRSVPGRE